MTSEKVPLEKSLGRLLGFEDGASDVLDHLLTIESHEDLMEYLSQLLGDDRQSEIADFVDNVERYKRGESILTEDDETSAKEQIIHHKGKPAARISEATELEPMISKGPTSKNQKAVPNRKSRVPPPKKQSAFSSVALETPSLRGNDGLSAEKFPVQSQPTTADDKVMPKQAVTKFRPAKGEAKKICGCFGTQHKPLTNCLYCGRIACVVEGYDFCAFCGYMIEEIEASSSRSDDPGWMLKERLLRFDREFARRTQIFDDQADFKGSTTWMNSEEREEADENERRQLESLKRPKQVLNIAL